MDIKLIREKPELVKRNLERRNHPSCLKALEEVIRADENWRKIIFKLNELRREKNKLDREIANLKKENKSFEEKLIKAKEVSRKIEKLERKEKELRMKIKKLLFQIPNLLDESVPFGKDENENVEIRKWGKPPKFKFKPKDHLTLLRNLGLIDFERGAKVSGHQFYYLKGKLVILDLALQRFAIDFLVKKGFTLIEPPLMISKRSYEGMIGNPFDFAEASYKIEGKDLYLIPTAEYSLGAMFQDEVFLAKDLPLKLCGVSPCFRREVGTHGKYSKGLFRVHHFNKVEQFVFCLPEQSEEIFQEIQKNSEKLYQKLGLHYRVVFLCSGDTGSKATKSFDIEIWMADGKYRECGSNSNCTDYQARRLNIRFRLKEGAPVKGFVHTLNNTALATSRTIIGIVEQFQQADGSIKIPKVLWKYCGFKKLEKE